MDGLVLYDPKYITAAQGADLGKTLLDLLPSVSTHSLDTLRTGLTKHSSIRAC